MWSALATGFPMATSVGEATCDYGFHVPMTVTVLREGGLERDPGADAALCCPSDRNFRTVAVAVAIVTTPHVTSQPPVAFACARMTQHNERKNITKNRGRRRQEALPPWPSAPSGQHLPSQQDEDEPL